MERRRRQDGPPCLAEALRELRVLKPDFESDAHGEMRWFADNAHIDHLLEGLRKADEECSRQSAAPLMPRAYAVAAARLV